MLFSLCTRTSVGVFAVVVFIRASSLPWVTSLYLALSILFQFALCTGGISAAGVDICGWFGDRTSERYAIMAS